MRYENKSIESKLKQEKLLSEQYKLASMGEMIDAIAHQWKSPLGIIRMRAEMLGYDINNDELNKEDIKEAIDSTITQVDHLNSTLDEFRKFFRPNTEKEFTSLKKLVDSTLLLLKDELLKNTIKVDVHINESFKLDLNQNEFKHVLINLIQNSRDAFIEKNVEERRLRISALKKAHSIILKVSDNAGGIPTDVIDNIFIPHFTTKSEGKGTGIGLYFTKQIVEKHNAKIFVENEKNGVCFFIVFNI
jgi:signal transduction histidine kinase